MDKQNAADARVEPVRFTFGLDGIELEDSGAGNGNFTVRGHAAVFNRPSHDMGGFRFKIAPGAFTKALDANPDVHLVLNHDMRWTLARTKNGTLELREDPMGLHMWARVAPTSYAADLRILLERGDVDQMSFAGFIEKDEWHVAEDGEVTATILEFSEIVDATICPQGAFPQTDVSVVAQRYFAAALDRGAVPSLAPAPQENPSPADAGAEGVALETAGADPLAELREYASRGLTVARAITR